MAFFRIKLDYDLEVKDATIGMFDVNDLITDGVRAAVPTAVQVLPGARMVILRQQRPRKVR